MIQKTPLVVCFGEVLWDIFPTYKRIGGAPLNVAYHLNKFGFDSRVITKLGKDDLGAKIIAALEKNNISTNQIQIDENCHTGTVFATFDDRNEASYDFLENSAWDSIDLRPQDLDIVSNSDAFVFGTLASRKQHTRKTLESLLEVASYKVFDVNFRPPHYDIKFVVELMHKANLIKMNKAELRQILEEIEKPYTTEEESIKYIQDHFKCQEIIVSKGSKGGIYYFEDKLFHFPSVEIVIKDTVGSGDSFLAGFLAEKLTSFDPIETLKKASSLGAFITSQAGACPEYELEDYLLFHTENIFSDDEIISSDINNKNEGI